ncbi:MAG: DUF4268 domain-containing protein [SAR202 cluster bacterium]|nr:DUF4268 domain-containing protein [SAR202 cluster bacterium]
MAPQTAKQLGKLQSVDVREIWPHEAKDFTPWLRDNVEMLSEAIGIDLDITEAEGEVGGFSVDLVGSDPGSGRAVVIENQLEPTDHDHLGKLITYSAWRNAGVAIWIATEFRDEHRQALDWLNTTSNGQQRYFGLQLGVYRIGDSLPAADFDVVVQPSQPPPALSPPPARQRAYLDFFSELLDEIKQKHPGLTSAKKAFPYSWFQMAAGRSGFSYGVAFTQNEQFRVEVYINWRFRKGFFLLREQKEQIESELGYQLVWEELPKDTRIATYTEGRIFDGPDRLAELRQWAVDKVGQFNKVFRSRIAALPKDLTAESGAATDEPHLNLPGGS